MSGPKRILLIAYGFPPENLPGVARPFRFFRYLPEFGWEPVVITASSQPATDPRIHYLANRADGVSRRSIRGLAGFLTRAVLAPGEPGLSWSRDAARAAAALHDAAPFTAVWSTFPPMAGHLAAALIERRLGIPWIADFRDPLANNPFRPRGWIPRRVDRWVEDLSFDRAARVVSVTDTTADLWRRAHPQHSEKIAVIWNGFDPGDPVVPLPTDPDFQVLAHIGTLYGARTPVCVLHSLARLAAANRLDATRLRLKFVGDYDEAAYQVCRALFEDLSRTFRIEYRNLHIPRDQARREMARSNFLLLADNNSSNTGYTVPAKLFEYIQVGRPILAISTPDSPVERILRDSELPYTLVQPDMAAEVIDERICGFLQLPTEPVEPSAIFRRKFDGRLQAGVLAELLDSVTASPGRIGQMKG